MRFPQTVAGITGVALAAAAFSAPAYAAPAGKPGKAWDFNGDGHRDKAVGYPRAVLGTKSYAGKVKVTYGGRKLKAKTLTRNSPGIPGRPRWNDRFGRVLSSADFNRDGYSDLLIGASWDTVIVYGSKRGLGAKTTLIKAVGKPTVTDFARDRRPDVVFDDGDGLSVVQDPGSHRKPTVQRISWCSTSDEEFALDSDYRIADYTGDGYPDLVWATGCSEGDQAPPLSLRRGGPSGLGRTKPYGKWANAKLLDADLNHDGIADLVSDSIDWNAQGIENYGDAPEIFLGGRQGFTRATRVEPGANGFPGPAGAIPFDWIHGDIDGDGLTDLAVEADAGKAGLLVLIVYGSKHYGDTTQVINIGVHGSGGPAIDLTDKTGDGRPDLYVTGKIYPNVDGRISPVVKS